MDAVVLAGGLGTRLRKVVADLPKCMAPVNGRPFLCYVLDHLLNTPVDRLILSVGFLHDVLVSYFGNEYKGIPVCYAVEDTPLGTGGAVKLASQQVFSPDYFVLNGDTLFKADLAGMWRQHHQKQADVSIALRRVNDVSRYGSVVSGHDARITSFAEKNTRSGQGHINGGIYIISRNYLDKHQFPEKFSLEKDCFEQYCSVDRYFGFGSDDYFIDIGIPEDYEKAQAELL